MRDFAGKTAFVTGAASGVGLALARAFAQCGMNVMLADIEAGALGDAAESLNEFAPQIRTIVCDVADSADVARAARETVTAFGKVHILCNNAGVGVGGGSGVDDISPPTWRWVMDVNAMGVVHGVAAFLPLIRAHGEGGHILNTASLAGLQAKIGFSPYVASKYAVVGMSEGLAFELAPLGIGVSILCPGFVKTNIATSRRNRPARYGRSQAPDPSSAAAVLAAHLADSAASGLDPAVVAALALDAIRQGNLYVFTHPDMRGEVDERLAALKAALDQASARK